MGLLALVLIAGCPQSPPPKDAPPAATSERKGGKTKDEPAPAPPVRPLPTPVTPAYLGLHARGVYASVGDASVLLDHDAATTWGIAGDALGDRVEIRLEAPVEVGEIELQGCRAGGPVTWDVRVNGSSIGSVGVVPNGSARRAVPGGAVEASLVSLVVAEGGDVCLASVALRRGGAEIPLWPPRAVEGTVRPSSVRSPPEAFHPWLLTDGRLSLPWTDGRAGTGGVGESLTVTLDVPMPITAVELWNGDQSGDAAWDASARLKKVGLSIDKGSTITVPVEPVRGPVQVAPPRPAAVHTLTLSVRETTDGARPLSVSELRLRDLFGPVAIATPARADRATVAAAAVGASPLASLTDVRLVGACDPTHSLRLRGDLDLRYVRPAGAAPPPVALRGPKGRALPALRERAAARPGEPPVSAPAGEWLGEWAPEKLGKPWSTLRFAGRVTDPATPLAPVPAAELGWWSEGEPRIATVQLARVADLAPPAFQAAVKEMGGTCLAGRADAPSYDALVARGAILLRGEGVADVLWAPAAP